MLPSRLLVAALALPPLACGCERAAAPGDAITRPIAEPVRAGGPASLVEQAVRRPAGAPDAARLERLPAKAREAVARATSPVLAPERPELLASATLTAKPAYWALHLSHGGLTVVVTSSRVAHRYEGLVDPARAGADGRVRGDRSLRGTDAWITRNEGIVSAAWTEDGAALSLELECARPDDERCAKDDELLALAASLAWIGGGAP